MVGRNQGGSVVAFALAVLSLSAAATRAPAQSQPDRVTGDPLPGELARDDATLGAAALTLAEDGWSLEFRPLADGAFTDAASGTCH